jgi:hypothetical protein
MSRGNWLMAVFAFLFFLALAFSQQHVHDLTYSFGGAAYDSSQNIHVTIDGTSAWAMSLTIPRLLLLLFGLFLPFITADLVGRDVQRRTHGLLMATAVPSWAYVWGRYLAGLVLSLALAGLMLLAVLSLGVGLWGLGGSPPATAAIMAIWAVSVLPATVLISGVSFALGTLWPRQTNLIKVGVLIGWLLGSTAVELQTGPSPVVAAWDPTSAFMSQMLDSQYYGLFGADPQKILDAPHALAQVRAVEYLMPDLGPWVGPHLLYVGLGLAAVGLAAWRFRRFRDV